MASEADAQDASHELTHRPVDRWRSVLALRLVWRLGRALVRALRRATTVRRDALWR